MTIWVAFDGQGIDNPGLVIEGYYTTDAGDGTNNLVVGQQENGNLYLYVPETDEKVEALHELADGVTASQTLVGDLESAAAFVPMPWLIGGMGLLGLAAAVAAGGDDESSVANHAPVATSTKVTVAENSFTTEMDLDVDDADNHRR